MGTAVERLEAKLARSKEVALARVVVPTHPSHTKTGKPIVVQTYDYERKTRSKLNRPFKVGAFVETPKGRGRVHSYGMDGHTVFVQTEGQGSVAALPFEISEVASAPEGVSRMGKFNVGETVMIPSKAGATFGKITRFANNDDGSAFAVLEMASIAGPEFSEEMRGKPITNIAYIPFDFTGPLNPLYHVDTIEGPDDGRTYGIAWDEASQRQAILYGSGDPSQIFDVARAQLVRMLEQNKTLEADSGKRNAWNGVVMIGLGSEDQSLQGAVGSKDWSCAIRFDTLYLTHIANRSANENSEMPPPGWTPKVSPQSEYLVSLHELAHGISGAAPDQYREDPGMEEGVVQGYTESLIQLQDYGPDDIGVGTINEAAGAGSYSSWVEGLDEAARLYASLDDESESRTIQERLTRVYELRATPVSIGERLEFYRKLMKIPLADRRKTLDHWMRMAGYHIELTGKGIGTKMGFVKSPLDYPATAGMEMAKALRSSIP